MSAPTTHARVDVRPQRNGSTVQRTVESLMYEERTRWAMHVHDRLTQSVTSAVLELQTLRRRLETDPAEAMRSLKTVEDEIRSDLREIREVLFELDRGEPTPEEPTFAGFVDELVARWKIPARVLVTGALDDAPEAILETAHGIVAEAIANAAKHSGSPDVVVRASMDGGELRLEIVDRGTGIAPVSDDDPHFGLRQMRSRAQKLGGTIDIESTPGHGTRVVAVLPVGGRGEQS